MYIYLH